MVSSRSRSAKSSSVPALLDGFALGGLLIALDRMRGLPDPLIPPQAFVLFVPVLYVAILVHELGHLILARAAGFELRTFMVGAFLFDKEVGGWRFRFVPRRLLGGGLTGAMPHSDEQPVKALYSCDPRGPSGIALLIDHHANVTGGVTGIGAEGVRKHHA
jgi:hypothetical protein